MRNHSLPRFLFVAVATVLIWASSIQAQALWVYQNLDEATLRVPRLVNRPSIYTKLEEVGSGHWYQNETMIFHDMETGAEISSLSYELCTDIANIERRCAWSCNGQYISFISNKSYWDLNTHAQYPGTWPGSSIARSDGANRRRLWGMVNGNPSGFTDKFNNWDQARPNVLYYPGGGTSLWRITLTGPGETDTVAENIFTFPTTGSKIIQELSDSNYMLIEESGTAPNCYVMNLNVPPTDPNFCMTYPLAGEVHPGSFRFRRSDLIVTGGYETIGGGICLKVDTAQHKLIPWSLPADQYSEIMWHLWYGAPDDRVCFDGTTSINNKFGLWTQLPGQPPVFMGAVCDGHPTWCGHDPDWAFYSSGTNEGEQPAVDPRYDRRIICAKADGSEVRVLCKPWDRKRGGTQGYDAIPRPNQSPDATKCWYHSSMLNTKDDYTGSYIAVFRKPYAPTDVAYSNGTLSWTPHMLSYEAKGYLVYKKNGDAWDLVTGTPVSGTSLATGPGKYMVTMQEWSGLESDTSSQVIDTATGAKTAPVTGWDRTPPPLVTGFTVTKEPNSSGQYRLRWNQNPAADLRYYNLYFYSFASPAACQKRLFMSAAVDQTEYLDWTAPPNGNAFYAITAVDRQGNESSPVFASYTSGPYAKAGDTNCDGKIDGIDLAILASDWDPLGLTARTWAQGDLNGDGRIDGIDLAALAQNWDPIGVDLTPIVTIAATDAVANEPGSEPATFTVTRVGPTAKALTVNYSISGTASAADYTPTLNGTVTIPANSWTADIVIAPVDDTLVEGDETLSLTLSPSANYTIGSPNSAAITILDNDTASGAAIVVNWGSAEAANYYGLPGWTTPFYGNYQNYSAVGPAGILGGSTGAYDSMGVSGTSRTFNVGDQIVVTWYNTGSSTLTINPKVNFTSKTYDSGQAGWYPMSSLTLAAGATGTTAYSFDAGSAGAKTIVNVCRETSGANNMLCDRIDLWPAGTTPSGVMTLSAPAAPKATKSPSPSTPARPSARRLVPWPSSAPSGL